MSSRSDPAATNALDQYREAAARTAELRRELDARVAELSAFVRDLGSDANLAFHDDGTYARGEACTLVLEDLPDFAEAIEARKRWETARDTERDTHSRLSAAERVQLAADSA